MIEIRDFTFQYRESERPAVSGISLAIPDGAFVGITGAAGSGKSTLTYALNGIIPHCYPGDFYGSVTVDGLDTCDVALTDVSRLACRRARSKGASHMPWPTWASPICATV